QPRCDPTDHRRGRVPERRKVLSRRAALLGPSEGRAVAVTTIGVEVGHADLGFDRLQVLDTPGVLNRSRRANPAEDEAEAAVSHAATAVLFVLDPSGTCGFTLED